MAVPRMILHNSLCGAIIRLNEGTIVKELGDGLMVRFANAGDAVVCAVRVIRNLRDSRRRRVHKGDRRVRDDLGRQELVGRARRVRDARPR